MQLFELKRHVPRRLALSRRTGALSAGETVDFTVLLHPKDDHALADAARAVADPKSPEYGTYRSSEDVRRLVAPGYQDLDAVLAWLHDAGIATEEPKGAWTVVRARGTADAVSRLVDAPIGTYRRAGRRGTSYAIERNPSIPASLAPIVRGIAGLNDLPAARLFPPPLAPKRSRVARRGASDTRGPGGGYTPAAIQAAYGVPPLHAPSAGGAGERIAILQFGGGYSPADFATYCETYGLPSGNVGEVSVSGGRNDFRGRTGDADVEVALDMDWVRAAAPNAAIDLYWVPNDDRGWPDFLAILLDLPEDRRPTIVSISWGLPEDGFTSSRRYDQTRQLFLQCALLGITFVCASGDAGASDEIPGTPEFDGQRHVDFPASIPEVTAVGGTKLVSTAGGFEETVWNDGGGATGGGFSRFVRVPPWQEKALGRRTSVTGRGVPDVAAVASPDPGLSIRVRKTWGAAGGTSVAAPLWAGFLAQVNAARIVSGRPRLGTANPVLYAAATGAGSPFRDVTRGDNGYAGVSGFAAGKGWDPVTGLGSPDVSRLVRI